MLNGLDLFSGIGGIGLALKPWVRTIAYCEQDRYAQGVLLSRMQSNDIDRAPIFTDVRKLRGEHFTTKPEIIFGGFPCQDISVAGAGRGLEGERSGLFFEICRLASELRPRFIFLENVPAISVRGLDRVLLELTSLRYDSRWTTLSASSVGANHRRDRWFLLAHSNSFGSGNEWKEIQSRNSEVGLECETVTFDNGPKKSLANSNCVRKQSKQNAGKLSPDWISNSGENVADSDRKRLSKPGPSGVEEFRAQEGSGLDDRSKLNSWWAVEPSVGRVANGIPNRVDRIKCLGNSVVPLQAREAFKKLSGWCDS